MILLFTTGLHELGEMMLPLVFKGTKARLIQQKNCLDLKKQTLVQPRSTLNDSINEELKVWSLPDCRARTCKIKETRGMSSSQEQGAFVREGSCTEQGAPLLVLLVLSL